MEYKRLLNVEKKLKRIEPLEQEYDRILKDYVSKGYARRLQPDEVAVRSDRLWYFPHFGVENLNKPGKVRLVFDAAAKVGGVSLNSELDKGPQRFKALPAVHFHFREGKVGVCGDIKEMFHQVLIRPEDRCSQRFLWRNGDDERDPDVYEVDVVGQFRCPRHYFVCGAVQAVELNVFVDASQAAFAVVAYWRVTYILRMCKDEVRPMSTMTIPWLELQAAVLGTRLINTVKEEHLVLWTDSKTVLRWIGSTHRRYKQFVGNRVAEIFESSKVSQ